MVSTAPFCRSKLERILKFHQSPLDSSSLYYVQIRYTIIRYTLIFQHSPSAPTRLQVSPSLLSAPTRLRVCPSLLSAPTRLQVCPSLLSAPTCSTALTHPQTPHTEPYSTSNKGSEPGAMQGVDNRVTGYVQVVDL